jgi:hypothetical protein
MKFSSTLMLVLSSETVFEGGGVELRSLAIMVFGVVGESGVCAISSYFFAIFVIVTSFASTFRSDLTFRLLVASEFYDPECRNKELCSLIFFLCSWRMTTLIGSLKLYCLFAAFSVFSLSKLVRASILLWMCPAWFPHASQPQNLLSHTGRLDVDAQ